MTVTLVAWPLTKARAASTRVELGQRRLQRRVHGPLAGGEARGGGGDAVEVDGRLGRRDDAWIAVQAEVVVGGEVEVRAPADHRAGAGDALMRAEERVLQAERRAGLAHHADVGGAGQGGKVAAGAGVGHRRLRSAPLGQPLQQRRAGLGRQAEALRRHAAAPMVSAPSWSPPSGAGSWAAMSAAASASSGVARTASAMRRASPSSVRVSVTAASGTAVPSRASSAVRSSMPPRLSRPSPASGASAGTAPAGRRRMRANSAARVARRRSSAPSAVASRSRARRSSAPGRRRSAAHRLEGGFGQHGQRRHARLAPGHAGEAGAREAAIEEGRQRCQRLGSAHGDRTEAALQPGRPCGVAGQHPGVGDRSPLHGERGPSGGATAARQRFHCGVGGDVGGLARAADGHGGRGEQHEQGQRVRGCEAIQVLRHGQLRGQHARDAARVERNGGSVLQNGGGVDHAADGRGGGAHSVQRPGECCGVGGIAALDHDVHAQIDEVLHRRARAGRRHAAARQQGEVPHAGLGQRPRRGEAEARCAADDDDGAFSCERERRIRTNRVLRHGWRTEHQLSDVAAGLKGAEGAFRLCCGVEGCRERPERPGTQAFRDGGEQACGHGRAGAGQFVHVHGEESGVAAEGAERDAAGFGEVALAQLDETAEGAEQAERALHRLAGQRVEYDVHALRPCGAKRVSEAGIAGVERDLGPCGAQEGALGGGAGSGRYACAGGERHLHRGEADRPGAAVDEHSLARLDARQLFQCVEGGEEGDRHRRGGFRVEAGWQRRERLGPRQGMGGEGGGRHAEDAVAVAERGAFAGFLHHAGAFHAEAGAGEAVQQRFLRQQALGPHHVAEVDPCGFDPQKHLARGRCRRIERAPVQGIELARIPHCQARWA